MNRFLLTIVAGCMAFGSLSAQNVEFKASNFPNDRKGFKEALGNYRRGMKYFEMGPSYFEAALDYYLKAEAFNPNEARLNYNIGFIYNTLGNDKAVPYLEKAMDLDARYKVHARYTLAHRYHLNKEWDKAITAYQEYIELLKQVRSKVKKSERFLVDDDMMMAELRIQQCKNGQNSAGNAAPVLITNMGEQINSKYPDYAPVISGDGKLFMFTTRREGVKGKRYAPYDIYPYEDIYFSTLGNDGKWSSAKPLDGKVNTKDHEATVWLSEDGKKLILYRYRREGDLFESQRNGDTWSKPKRIKHINSAYRETHASITADGKTIYFTSDNPRLTKGDRLDIYKIVYNEEKKKWSKPENVGETINTVYDEACVHISPDGKVMYFSSEGHSSIGGLDIFRSELVDGKWTTPVNVGFPVNSTSNDIFITISADESHYYMDSDRRNGVGDKDIYAVKNLTAVKVPLVVKVYDNVSHKVMDATVTLERQDVSETVDITREASGKYTAELASYKKYNMVVKAEGYTAQTVSLNTAITDPENIGIQKDVYLEPEGMFVLNGHVLDKDSRKKVKATIQVVEVSGNRQAGVSGADGDFTSDLANGKEYKVTITAEGYTPYVEVVKLDKNTDKEFLLTAVGMPITLHNIYFDYNKASLRSESVEELKRLREILEKSPDMNVEISAHTDNKGSASYNYSLSNRRAKAVVDWLISNGVKKGRFTWKGFGFDQPAATNDTDEGRQLNRRVEFKLVKK